jgi:hypothetical protein
MNGEEVTGLKVIVVIFFRVGLLSGYLPGEAEKSDEISYSELSVSGMDLGNGRVMWISIGMHVLSSKNRSCENLI